MVPKRAAKSPVWIGLFAAFALIPCVAVVVGSQALADGLATQAGGALADALPPPPPPSLAAPVPEAATPAPSASASAPSEVRLSSKQSAKKSAPKGILVRAAAVERAVRSGQQPSGSPVPAAGARPAGVALSGVSGFGTGLHDGDIVVQVGGLKTPSVELVIVAVAGAVTSGATALSAVVWRGSEELPVTVEIPDMGQRKAAAAKPKTKPAKATKQAAASAKKRGDGHTAVGDR